jgi:hypothetical protein
MGNGTTYQRSSITNIRWIYRIRENRGSDLSEKTKVSIL